MPGPGAPNRGRDQNCLPSVCAPFRVILPAQPAPGGGTRQQGPAQSGSCPHRLHDGTVEAGNRWVLGQGVAMDGARWTLTAEFARHGLYTMAQVVDADGHRWGGGMGGPPLWPGSRVNSSVHSADRGPHLMVLRVAVDVRATVAILSDGTREDLRLWGDVNRLMVRAAVLIYPRELDLHRLVLLDHHGQELPDTV